MAKRPTARAAAAKAADDIPAMDYPAHQATYEGFLGFVKWSIVALAITVVALYCFIEAHQPILGTLLLLLIPVGAIGLVIIGPRRR